MSNLKKLSKANELLYKINYYTTFNDFLFPKEFLKFLEFYFVNCYKRNSNAALDFIASQIHSYQVKFIYNFRFLIIETNMTKCINFFFNQENF